MIKTKLIFLLIILNLLFSSCVKPATGPTESRFRIGSRWLIRYTAFKQDGTVAYSDDQLIRVVRELNINGTKYYITDDSTYFANKPDGYYQYDKYLQKEIIRYKKDAALLDIYTAPYLTSEFQTSCFGTHIAQVLNKDTSVVIIGKKFDKLIYYSIGSTSTCQINNMYTSKELFSTKLGLWVQIGNYNMQQQRTESKIELVYFIY